MSDGGAARPMSDGGAEHPMSDGGAARPSRGLQICANRDTCRGYGNCVLAAPELFELDDDGLVVVLQREVDESLRGQVERAIYDCPTDSIATG